jgi:RNA polymerase sigma-70 factor (ECF subfamily)
MCGQETPERRVEGLEKTRDVLARRLKTGDREAAAELIDIYYEQIYRYMRRLGHDRQVSEDLTQETFLSAWQHIGQLRSSGALAGWLYRIAGNVSKGQWRKIGAEKVGIVEGYAARKDLGEAGRLEELGRLYKAVDELPRKLKAPVILHYMQRLSIADAAEAIGVRQGTLKSRLNRAIRRLKKNMESKGELTQ